MVRTPLLLLALGVGLLAPAPAAAGPLVSAMLSVQIEIGLGATLTLPGTGVSGSAASPTSVSIAAGSGFRGFTYAYLSGPELTYAALTVGSNGPGHFGGPTPNRVGGSMPITATARIEGLVKVAYPLVIGAPSSRFSTRFTKSGGIGLAVTGQGASWTAGTAKETFSGMTFLTITGANLLTPAGGGTLVLVSPSRILTTAGVPVLFTPSFLTLTFAPVPEPGTLALVACGVAALAALGRRAGPGRVLRAPPRPSE